VGSSWRTIGSREGELKRGIGGLTQHNNTLQQEKKEWWGWSVATSMWRRGRGAQSARAEAGKGVRGVRHRQGADAAEAAVVQRTSCEAGEDRGGGVRSRGPVWAGCFVPA
jgi:hypothetical protein